LPQLFQFCHDTVGDGWDALGEQTVHAGLENVQLVLDAEVDEVGVDQDLIRGAEGHVVLEKEPGGGLFTTR
jgi:hypothetical protein